MTEKKKYEPYNKQNWWKTGILFGLVLFLFIAIVFPLFIQNEEFQLSNVIRQFVVCVIGGIGYGYWMKNQGKKKAE